MAFLFSTCMRIPMIVHNSTVEVNLQIFFFRGSYLRLQCTKNYADKMRLNINFNNIFFFKNKCLWITGKKVYGIDSCLNFVQKKKIVQVNHSIFIIIIILNLNVICFLFIFILMKLQFTQENTSIFLKASITLNME